MIVLALETATAVCAAAIVRDRTVVAERSLNQKHVHSEKLVTLIDEVVTVSEGYDVVAVSIVPGSFTGLRIGLSVAKGLTFASGKSLVAVPTLTALAWRAVHFGFAQKDDEVISMIDARRNDVYAASFCVDDVLSDTWGPEALTLDAVAQRVSSRKRTVFMGDGVDKFLQHYPEAMVNSQWVIPASRERLCNAASVGLLAVAKAERREFADLSSLEPLYVKDFVTLVRTQHSSSLSTGTP